MGIHTPEFPSERLKVSVEDAVRGHQLGFPHLLDNDHAYWNALGNQYWPSLYLVDRCRRIRATAVGEVHADTPRARRLEVQIESLLDESADDCAAR